MAAVRGFAQTVLAVGAVAALGAPAMADWSADVSHDATGELKVAIMGDVQGGRSIYATCNPDRQTILALLVPAGDPTLSTSGMTLSFAFADGTHWTASAALYRYDNTLVAVGYGNANDVPAIVEALAGAQSPVQVGLTSSAGAVQTWSADVNGSTAAAREFLDNCFNTN